VFAFDFETFWTILCIVYLVRAEQLACVRHFIVLITCYLQAASAIGDSLFDGLHDQLLLFLRCELSCVAVYVRARRLHLQVVLLAVLERFLSRQD
jgi:hypothetical protein